MTEWREYRLSDIMDIISGGTPKTSVPEYWSGNIPWLSVADFNNVNRYVYDTEKHISELGLKNSSTKILKKGQLIISARGTVGALAQLKRDMAFNQSCYGLNANSLTTNDFLFYLLKYCIAELKQQSSGGVFDTIIRETFDNISVFLPPLPEQKAIAEVLSSLDDKIDLLTRQNKTLEDLAQAYFRKWFIEDASDEWEVGKAKDYFEIGIGKTPPRKEEHWFSKNNNDVVWVSISDMGKAGMFIGDSSEYLTKNAVKQFNIKRVPKGAIILSFKLTVGRVAIALRDFTTNEAIAHFIYRNLYEREYLYFYLKTFDYYSLGSTSSIATAVNSKIIKDMPFVMPDVETLKKYHKIAAPMFSKIESNTNQILTLQKIRDTLLTKLISGEIRVKM